MLAKIVCNSALTAHAKSRSQMGIFRAKPRVARAA
jgi:hypothetical protein